MKNRIFDTHTHLYFKEYEDHDIKKVTFQNGVDKVILVGCDESSSMVASQLAIDDGFYYSVGLQPNSLDDELNVDFIQSHINNKKLVAIGEIGLDYYHNIIEKKIQKEIFEKQLVIAIENNLPIIIHVRDAYDDVIEILKKYRSRGVIHCFNGDIKQAIEFVKLGYYLGIGGVITYKNALGLNNVVINVGIDCLVTETDCPYLAPAPHRGKTNYPHYLNHVIEHLAKIKNMDVNYVYKILYNNACKLFLGGNK